MLPVAHQGADDRGGIRVAFMGSKVQDDTQSSELGQFVNTVANLVYSAVPWGRAFKSRWRALVKLGALGVKSLTPEWAPFSPREGEDPRIAEVLNEVQQILLGVDLEDFIKQIGTRGLIRAIKRYAFMNEDGGIQFTTSFFVDP